MDRQTLARLTLNRLGFGPSQAQAGMLDSFDPGKWLEEQLHPLAGDDAVTAQKLAAVRMHVKYDARNGAWGAIDEMRPLATIDQPIEAVWHLTDGGKIAGQERGLARDEVAAATLTRAIYAPAQLREVMTDFWHNHFNVNAGQYDGVSVSLPSYDRDVIRTHCLGNFREFLEAVGSHAAMLIYLNNRTSRAGEANENYGRELFELHTLGSPHYLNALYDKWKSVPGALQGRPIGYIDGDVYESARAFTGWAIEDGTGLGGGQSLPATGKFVYVDSWHDNYQKRVLATDFDPFAAPMSDGRKVFDLIAFHPGTANYVCTKLCRRLVSDNPPQSLIDAAVKVWTAKARDRDQIAGVVRAIVHSPDFAATPPLKVKRPLELAAGFVRSLGIDFTVNDSFVRTLDFSGQRLFAWAPPTGHPDYSDYWIGTNGLRQRLNLLFTIALNNNQTGVFHPAGDVGPGSTASEAAMHFLTAMVPAGDVVSSRDAVLRGLGQPADRPLHPEGADGQDGLRKLAVYCALSPAFQTR